MQLTCKDKTLANDEVGVQEVRRVCSLTLLICLFFLKVETGLIFFPTLLIELSSSFPVILEERPPSLAPPSRPYTANRLPS